MYHFYSLAVETDFYGDAGRMIGYFTVKQCALRLVPGWVTFLLDFVEDPTNATFGGSGGMNDHTTIISGPRQQEQVSLPALHSVCSHKVRVRTFVDQSLIQPLPGAVLLTYLVPRFCMVDSGRQCAQSREGRGGI